MILCIRFGPNLRPPLHCDSRIERVEFFRTICTSRAGHAEQIVPFLCKASRDFFANSQIYDFQH